MALKLYNTLARKTQVFKPIEEGKVGFYSCGPTVYWYQHIGNLRTYIFNDILKRVLIYHGFKVKHVMNVTDVGHLTSDADEGEDKIEKAAKKEKKTATEIANYYLDIFKQDLQKLNIIFPDVWCKATDHIKEQLDMVKILEKRGYTYQTSDGIYFDTSKLNDYGKLSKFDKKYLEAGKRVLLGEKRNKTDFALWKFSTKDEKRQQEWKSPWAEKSFPGWHIECSAMSSKYLGKQFDIHTGGQEHIQIHHTNEIAQSEAAFKKKPWVKYWLHAAWLLSKGKKVSKSKGGLFTISELQEKGFGPLDFRYLCLNTHYKKPLNFDLGSLEAAKISLKKLKEKIQEINKNKEQGKENGKKYKDDFLEAINDDLNMPKALGIFWNLIKDEKVKNKEKLILVEKFDQVFGLDLMKIEQIPQEVQDLVVEREEARNNKDWKRSDELREEIKKKGYIVEDTAQGPRVKIL